MNTKNLLLFLAVFSAGIVLGVVVTWKYGQENRRTGVMLSEDKVYHKQNGHVKSGKKQVVKISGEEMEELGIQVETAVAGKLQVNVSFSGEIVVNPDSLAHIVPRVAGIVKEVRMSLGNLVQAEEVMAVIESRELADTKATYLANLERLALAQASFEREEKLWQRKISSEQEYLSAKQAHAETKINLRSAEQKLHALGFGDEYLKRLPELSDEWLTRYEIRAPFDGTVIQKHITLGERVSDSTNVFTVADLTDVWVNLTVYQKDFNSLRLGQQVVVKASQNDNQIRSMINYISPLMDESTRTATARVVIDNRNGTWQPGMFVTGLVEVNTYDVTLIVPRRALQTINDHTVVFVQTLEGFEPRSVQIGKKDKTHVEIIAGLEPGQRYVTNNAFTLKAELGKSSLGDGHNH